MTNQLTFHGTTLTTISQDNQTWLTSRDLAKALGYAKLDGVSRVYDRHADEFTACMALTVKLTAKGFGNGSSLKMTRIFSLRGCHLIAMFSKTKEAKDFRQWVLNILDKEVQPEVISEQPQPEAIEQSKHGFSRMISIYRNGMLVDSYPLKFTDGIVNFEKPEILKEMIRDTFPEYTLVKKAEILKALNFK